MWNYNNTNELYHWKYIRRERVGDKWRYYYDKDDKRLTTTQVYSKSATELGPSYAYVGKDKKVMISGPKSEYRMATDKTKGVEVEVDRKTYDKMKVGTNRMVGDTPLKEVNKQNLDMAKNFIKDLIAGNVYIKPRTKKKNKK